MLQFSNCSARVSFFRGPPKSLEIGIPMEFRESKRKARAES